MVLLLFAILVGFADDEFQCTFAELTHALPRLKIVLKPDNYNNLLSMQRNLSEEITNKKPLPASKNLGSMIATCVNEQDRLLCFATIKIRYGMLSITDPNIAKYLEMNQGTIELVRRLNTSCLNDIKQLIGKLPDESGGEQYATMLRKAKARYQDGLLQLKQKLANKQVMLFDVLFATFNHDQVVLDLLATLNGERMRSIAIAKGYAKAHPNIQLHIKSKGLIMMGHKVAKAYLELSPEQDDSMTQLYKDYIDAVEQLQLSLSSALVKEPTEETFMFHMLAAQKVNTLYTDRFLKLLTNHQKALSTKLLCQVIGYKYCQTSPVKEEIGITEEQSRRSLEFGMKCKEEFGESMQDSEFDYEKKYRFEKYYSERIKNEMLTEEQRGKWKAFIGKEIPEGDLKVLQKDYCVPSYPESTLPVSYEQGV